MDRLERSWLSISRPSQKWTSRRVELKCAEELHCDICGDGDTTAHNIIVLCEGCDVAVHQECYGVPLIPEGPWLCRKCYLGISDVNCCLCPWKRGALKQTTCGAWCHLICSSMLPNETHVLNTAYQEPIDISRIHNDRWSLLCQGCKQRFGAPTQCAVKTCHMALHPKCAQFIGCKVDEKQKTLYCWKHSGSGNNSPTTCPIINSSTLSEISGHSIHERLFLEPVIPHLAAEAICRSLSAEDVPIAQCTELVEKIARYWSLKRKYRRGAALIKSLQVEPWTSGGLLSNVGGVGSRKQLLLDDLKNSEKLASLIHQREKHALSVLLTVKDLLEIVIYPLNTIITVLINEFRYWSIICVLIYYLERSTEIISLTRPWMRC